MVVLRKYKVISVKVGDELYQRLKSERRRRVQEALDREQDNFVTMSAIVVEALEKMLGRKNGTPEMG